MVEYLKTQPTDCRSIRYRSDGSMTMRVVKEAEERKNEILDVAERLFTSKGFDNTSTNDILKEIGIARGTLYYHFRSKEDILNAMIDRTTQRLITKATAIAKNREMPLLKRLTMTIMALNMDVDSGHEILEQIHKPQNALMYKEMQNRLLSRVNPILTDLIKEAIEQGICDTAYPLETVEMVMLYSNTAFDILSEYSKGEQQQKIAAFIYNLERLLGMESGQLQSTILPVFQRDDNKELKS